MNRARGKLHPRLPRRGLLARMPAWCAALLLAACSAAPPMPDPPPEHPAAANAEAAPREAPSTTLQLPAAEAKR